MAEEKHHHHPFHHKEQDSGPVDHEKEERQHKHKEHLGEMGTGAATGFTLYEKHRGKKDPENGHKHKVEKDIAAAVAVGGAAYTFHEKHEKKDAKKEEKHEKKEAKKEEKHSEGHHRFL